MKPSARDTPWCLAALLCLLLAGCSEDVWYMVTPSAWAMAEKKCAVNDGVKSVVTSKLRSGGYRVRVRCANDMSVEFFSSAEAR